MLMIITKKQHALHQKINIANFLQSQFYKNESINQLLQTFQLKLIKIIRFGMPSSIISLKKVLKRK